MLNLRKGLIDKIIDIMQDCDLFKVNGIYPRKYFDDLMLADKLTDQYLKKPFELMRSSSNIR